MLSSHFAMKFTVNWIPSLHSAQDHVQVQSHVKDVSTEQSCRPNCPNLGSNYSKVQEVPVTECDQRWVWWAGPSATRILLFNVRGSVVHVCSIRGLRGNCHRAIRPPVKIVANVGSLGHPHSVFAMNWSKLGHCSFRHPSPSIISSYLSPFFEELL